MQERWGILLPGMVDGEILYKLSYAGKEVDIPLRAFTKMNAFCDSKRALEAKLNEIYQEKPFQNIYLVGGAATDFSYLKALNSFLLSKMPVVINIVRPHALRHAVCMGNLLYNEMKKSHIARELPVNLHLLVMESSDKIYIKNIFKKFQLEGGMEETYITCQKAILFYGDYKENSSWYPIKEYKINNNLTKLTFRWGNDERYGISLSITEKNITSGIVQKSVICLANLFWKDNSNRDSLFQAKKMLDLYQKYYLGINKVNLMFLIDNTPSMQEEDIDLKESKIDLVLEIFYNIIGNYDKLQIAYALYGDYPGYEEDTSQYILYLSQESDLNNTEKTLATLLESPLLKKIKDKQPLSPFFVYSDKEDLIKQIRKNVKEFKVEGFDKEEALFSALLMCTLVQYLPGVTIIIIMTDSRYHVENSPNYSNEQEYLKKYYKKEIDIQLRDILKQFMQSNPNVVFFCIPLSESTDVRGALEDIMYYNAAIFKKNPLFKNLFGIDVDKTTIISNLKNAITAAQTLNPSRLPEELVNYISDLNL